MMLTTIEQKREKLIERIGEAQSLCELKQEELQDLLELAEKQELTAEQESRRDDLREDVGDYERWIAYAYKLLDKHIQNIRN